MKNKFKEAKQAFKQEMNRMGDSAMKSNVPMAPSPLITNTKKRMLMVQNFVDDSVTGRRRLVGLSELDVSRDVMDVKFITTSD